MKGGKGSRAVKGAGRTEKGRMLVLLDQIHEQNKATIDAVFAMGNQLERKLGEQIQELKSRVDRLELAIAQLVQESKRHSQILDEHSERLDRIESDLLRIKTNLELKANAAELMDLDRRLTALEREVRG